MQVTVQIHEAWLARPEDLRRVLALLAGLEVSCQLPVASCQQDQPGPRPTGNSELATGNYDDPERPAPARRKPDRGDAWEPPADEPDKDAPRDGRQLLGWASKQQPDLKGLIIGWGKKKGLASKIVEWSPQEVADAYRFARRQQSTTR